MPSDHPHTASARRALPRLWLLTDERQGEQLWPALRSLPRGAGVIVRHYSLAPVARDGLFAAIRRVARRRRLTVLIAGTLADARRLRADGVYGSALRHPPAGLLSVRPAHDLPELVAARRAGAHAALLSPVFATRSHAGARTLGPVRSGLLARQAGLPVLALGGMTKDRARRIAPTLWGWAAIDGLAGRAGDQKRKAVPR